MINVKCPNADCGKVLTVKDELAGKRIKCRACGGVLTVPANGTRGDPSGPRAPGKKPQSAGDALTDKPRASRPSRTEPPPAGRKRRDEEDDPDEVEGEEEEDRPPSRSSNRRRRDAEEDDEDEEEEDRREARRRPPPRRRREEDVDEDEDEEDEEDEDEEVGFQRRGPSEPVRADWSKIRSGVYLIYVRMCCSLGAAGSLLGGLLLALLIGFVFEKPMAFEILAKAFVIGAGLLSLAAVIASLTGHGYCCLAPENFAAKILAIASLALAVVVLLLDVVAYFVPGLALSIVLLLATVAYHFVFLFFLRALALCLKALDLADNIRNFIIAYGATLATGLITLLIMAMVTHSVVSFTVSSGMISDPSFLLDFAKAMGLTLMMLFFLFLIVGLGLFCWFLINLVRLLEDMDKKLGRKRAKSDQKPLWVLLMSMDGVFVFIWLILFMVAYMKAMAPPAPKNAVGQAPAPPARAAGAPGLALARPTVLRGAVQSDMTAR